VHQGGVGGPRPEGDTNDKAIKTGKWKSEWWVFASGVKWRPYAANYEFEVIMETVYPRPAYNMTFLGYMRPNVNATEEG
jgi:hypothetical protein